MTASRVTAAELAELRAQYDALAGDAERISAALKSANALVAIMAGIWQDGFDKGQETPKPAVPAQPTKDRHGFRLLTGIPGGTA